MNRSIYNLHTLLTVECQKSPVPLLFRSSVFFYPFFVYTVAHLISNKYYPRVVNQSDHLYGMYEYENDGTFDVPHRYHNECGQAKIELIQST